MSVIKQDIRILHMTLGGSCLTCRAVQADLVMLFERYDI